MITPAACTTMARYNQWMNERLYAVCAALPDAARKEDRGAPFRSIHGTLNHLLLADHIWMARFHGRVFPIRSLDQELHSSFDALQQARRAMEAEILAWVNTLTETRLAGPLTFTSVVNPQERTVPLWFAVQHFFNHQTHHRGQLTTVLEQLGCDFGITDLIWLPEGP